MSEMESMVNHALKPAVNGAVTAVVMRQVGGKNLRVFGQSVPSWYVTGSVGAASSLLGDLAHSWILPHLSPNDKFAQFESSLLSPAIAGAAQVAALEWLSPGSVMGDTGVGTVKVMALGAGAEIAGQYVYEQSLVPLEESF